jgi:hypothetical protein
MLVYVSIGNSDDKLSQHDWANYISEVRRVIGRVAVTTHGVWFSCPDVTWQNMCIGFEILDQRAPDLRDALRALATYYAQDSVAWAGCPEVESVCPTDHHEGKQR